jgi:hypothetical protein
VLLAFREDLATAELRQTKVWILQDLPHTHRGVWSGVGVLISMLLAGIMVAQEQPCGAEASRTSEQPNHCEQTGAGAMTETPTDDKPGFVAEEPEHCRACYRLIHPGETYYLTVGQAISAKVASKQQMQSVWPVTRQLWSRMGGFWFGVGIPRLRSSLTRCDTWWMRW